MARLQLGLGVLVFTLLSCRSASGEPDIFHRFIKFVEDFSKPYKNGTEEFRNRLEIFKNNLLRIEKLNVPYGEEESAVFGVTKFSDLSQEEFKAQYLEDLSHKPLHADKKLRFISEKSAGLRSASSLSQLPQKVDWRSSGAVSAIKNQGSCGACWAFSSTEVVESAYAIAHNTTVPNLAVQELIDCSKKNKGCQGGDICEALAYVQSNGIVYDKAYPLTDKDGNCHAVAPGNKVVKITSYSCSSFVDKEDQILETLATVGPVATAVDATTWNNYVGGIIKYHCQANINHAVDIVGYDLTGPVPYYIVRNSWGTDFGVDGYIYIKVGSNLCGIAAEVGSVHVT